MPAAETAKTKKCSKKTYPAESPRKKKKPKFIHICATILFSFFGKREMQALPLPDGWVSDECAEMQFLATGNSIARPSVTKAIKGKANHDRQRSRITRPPDVVMVPKSSPKESSFVADLGFAEWPCSSLKWYLEWPSQGKFKVSRIKFPFLTPAIKQDGLTGRKCRSGEKKGLVCGPRRCLKS